MRATHVHNDIAPWLTTTELAGLLRLSTVTVRRHADDLGGVRIGRVLRFPTPVQAPTLDMSARGPHPVTRRLR